MAPNKRKRETTRTSTNKRAKYTVPDTDSSSSSSAEEEIAHDSQEEWDAVRILEQRRQGHALQYYIEWKGRDPATGEPWAPTWERASNASKALRASWRVEQARRARKKEEATSAARRGTQHRSARKESPAPAIQAGGARRSRTVGDPGSSTSAKATVPPTEPTQSTAASQHLLTIDLDALIPDDTSPQVNVGVRGDSFNRSDHEPFTETAESRTSPEESAADTTSLESSSLPASQPDFLASGVVRNTQSSAGDESYIPVTQEELESSLHSESSEESDEDNVIGYSGLLDTDGAPKPSIRAHSPATSIAETVPDTTQDVHSQHQLESQQEHFEGTDILVSQSPATSNKSDPSRPLSNGHRAELTTTQPSDSVELRQVESFILSVENTTQSEYQTPIPEAHRSEQEQEKSGVATQEGSEAITTYLAASFRELESLAIEDTSQISQLTPTAGEESIQEAQLSSAHLSELSAEPEPEVSVIESSLWEDIAQFPFHSQYPAVFEPQSVTKPTQRVGTEPPRTPHAYETPYDQLKEVPTSGLYQQSGCLGESERSTTIDEISQSLGEGTPRTLPEDHPNSQLSHSKAINQGVGNTASRRKEYTLEEAETASTSQPPLPSTEQPNDSREHDAQLVSSCAYSNTPERNTGSIRGTTEIDTANVPRSRRFSRSSRHDSSQETPERGLQSEERSSSPIPHPPSYSLRTLDSNVPPRPATPLLNSSLLKMTEGTAESPSSYAHRRLESMMAARKEENRRSRAAESSVTAFAGTVVNDAASQANNAFSLPTASIAAEGTRSPSTVPDQSPALPPSTSLRTVPAPTAVPTSLRAVAFYNANKVTEPLNIESPVAKSVSADKSPPRENDDLAATTTAAAAAQSVPVVSSPPAVHDDIEDSNDVEDTNDIDGSEDYDDDEDEDPYDDELKLDDGEYIVPLNIEGRQRDTYTEYIKQKEELLNEVHVHKMAADEKLNEVDRALAYMRDIETHPDLTYAEAESATGLESRSLANIQHGAQFGVDNSVKFKFLERLFDLLRDKKMHVVLLLDQDRNALSNIIKTLFIARGYNFKMPAEGYHSTASADSLMITVFPKTLTPVLPRVNLIVCLDGVQSATQARQKKYPASGKTIPVIHLVIPQTVGHIERYILPTMERRDRIEKILDALARLETRDEVGTAIDVDTPSARQAAQMVASWLVPEENEESTEWPLPSIGSARSLIESDATQQPTTSSPAPERIKRPLEEDDLDSAKRMRYTPQPRVLSSSNAVNDPEVTRVRDSMPGTAASENARLATSLDKVSAALLHEQNERREEAIMWDKQQTEHEIRQGQYRQLQNEKAAVDRDLATMTANREKIRGVIDTQIVEIKSLREEVEALRSVNLASSDEKNVEITRLRKELEATKLECDKARNTIKTQDETMEFLKEQYRNAQVSATQASSEVESLKAQNDKLAHQASGEAAKLKQLHFDRNSKNILQQAKARQSEIVILKAALKTKDEELARAKNNSGRAAYGTRGQSTTPQPKTRSRAASPERGSRAQRGGGRISNLVAEES